MPWPHLGRLLLRPQSPDGSWKPCRPLTARRPGAAAAAPAARPPPTAGPAHHRHRHRRHRGSRQRHDDEGHGGGRAVQLRHWHRWAGRQGGASGWSRVPQPEGRAMSNSVERREEGCARFWRRCAGGGVASWVPGGSQLAAHTAAPAAPAQAPCPKANAVPATRRAAPGPGCC